MQCTMQWFCNDLLVAWSLCYTEKAAPTRHRPERQHNARANRRKQCSPNETKPYSKPTLPRKRQTNPTNGHTPRRWKPTHTRLTYTRMRPHAPSHQAGDHPVPAHTELHNPPRLRTRSHTVWLHADSFLHSVASPFHSFVTIPQLQAAVYAVVFDGVHVSLCCNYYHGCRSCTYTASATS